MQAVDNYGSSLPDGDSTTCVTHSRMVYALFICSRRVGDVIVPRTGSVRLGPRGFSSAGPSLWNSLPTDLKVTNLAFNVFTNLLKTHLFRKAYYQLLDEYIF